VLQIASAVATGVAALAASDAPQVGDVLYLALEDSQRRLQRRLSKLFGLNRQAWPNRLTVATEWQRLDRGGLEELRRWCLSTDKPALIVIDVLKRVRPPKERGQTDYDADYVACEGLREIAAEFQIGIIVVTHTRKMGAEDVFDTVSGTLGLTGGVDTIAILKRNAQGVTLHVEGRDLTETIEKAVTFDRESCRWSIVGEAAEVLRSAERSRVLRALQGAPAGLSSSEIASMAELRNRNAADLLLSRMAADGLIERVKRGQYALPGTRASLVPKKEGQKDRQRHKSLKIEDDKHLSVDLSLCPGPPEKDLAIDSVEIKNAINIAPSESADGLPDIPTFLRRGHGDCIFNESRAVARDETPKASD
jgi:hypothetical protein